MCLYQNFNFFDRNRKNTKIYVEPQKTLNSQNNLRKKSKAGTTMLPSFKLLYNVIVFKTVW